MVIPLAFIIRVFSGPMSDRKYREWELQGEIASLTEQTLTAIPVVQAFGREECEDRRFKNLAQATVKASLHSEFAQHQFQLSTGTVAAIAKMVVLVVGGMAVLHGGLSVGSLLVLVTYYTALYSPIETLAYLSEGFASASAGARRVFEILESDSLKLLDRPGARVLPASFPAGVRVRFK
jgi:ATP-binding cassette subfamily B protein/subfamily B ATP-binding cassette protein MsbA